MFLIILIALTAAVWGLALCWCIFWWVVRRIAPSLWDIPQEDPLAAQKAEDADAYAKRWDHLIADPNFGTAVLYIRGRWITSMAWTYAPNEIAEAWAAAHPELAARVKTRGEAEDAKQAARAALAADRAAALRSYATNDKLRAQVRAGRTINL